MSSTLTLWLVVTSTSLWKDRWIVLFMQLYVLSTAWYCYHKLSVCL